MTKVRLMAADASPSLTDLFYMVIDPATTPADRKVAGTALATLLAGASDFTDAFVAKVPPIVYAKDFGAVGDGTTNNYAALTAALTSLAGGPGIVWMDPGSVAVPTVYGVSRGIKLEPDQVLYSPQIGYAALGATLLALPAFAPGGGEPSAVVWNNTALFGHGIQVIGMIVDADDVADHAAWFHSMGEESGGDRSRFYRGVVSCVRLTGLHAAPDFKGCSVWHPGTGGYGWEITEHPSIPADGNLGVLRFNSPSGDNGTAGSPGPAAAYMFTDGSHSITIHGLKSELWNRVVEVAGTSISRIKFSGSCDAIRGAPAAGELVKVLDTARPTIEGLPDRADQYLNLIDDDVKGIVFPSPTSGPHASLFEYAGNPVHSVSYGFSSRIQQSNSLTKPAQRLRRYTAASTSRILQLEDETGTAMWTEADMVRGGVLTTGEATMHRDEANTNGIAMTSGSMRLAYLNPTKTEVIDKIRVHCGAAAAASGSATIIRMGVYSVAANGDLTLVGSTPNNTTLLIATATAYTVDLSATEPIKTAGAIIAVGLLVVTVNAIPQVVGHQAFVTGAENAEAPRLSGLVTGLTDLPASVAAGSVGSSTVRPFFVCLP